MTDIIATLPPAEPPSPPTSADPVADRSPSFGPALAEAQRLDTARSGGSSADDQRPETSDSSTETERPASDPDVSSEPAEDGEQLDETGGSAALPAALQADVADATDGTASPPETAASMAAALDAQTQDHPTAKGTIGDGGRSTDIAVGQASSPASPDVDAVDSMPNPSAKETSPEASTSRAARGAAADTAEATVLASTRPTRGAVVETPKTPTGETTSSTVGEPGSSADPSTPPADGRVGASAPAERGERAAVPAVTTTPQPDATPTEAVAEDASQPIRPGTTGDRTVDDAASPVRGSERSIEVPAVRQTSTPSPAVEPPAVAGQDLTRTAEANRTTPTTAPPPGPLDAVTGSLWDDVRAGLERMRTSSEGQEVRIRLHPAELGELIVQVRTQGDQVAVRLVTTSAAAQQALVDDRLRLAAELARAGFEQGSVDIGREDASSFGQPGQQPDADRERGRTIVERGGLRDRAFIERRDPIRTEAAFRPGRHAYSTINLTL